MAGEAMMELEAPNLQMLPMPMPAPGLSCGDLHNAMSAASCATNACGGFVPLAARQVSPGLWCVLLSDPQLQAAQEIQERRIGEIGLAWLDAEQHLPIGSPEKAEPQVAWSAPKSSQSAGWAAAAGWAAETAVHRCQAQKAALEQVEHAGAHAELSPQRATSAQPRHWERHAWQSWEVQTPSQTPCPARKKKSWKKSQTATVKMFRRDDRSSREEGRGRKPSSEEPDDELHQRTVWHLIEKVLLQRPQLEAGKRVTVEIPEWIFDATQNVAYDHSSDPRRSMVNRALRGMSKKLPGCCWTDLRMWREYAEAVLFHAGALKPNHMAFIANGFARAEVPDREVFQRMSEEAVGLVEHFEPRARGLGRWRG
eukprot:g2880.t1